MKTEPMFVDSIRMGEGRRRIDPAVVDRLAESMDRLGLLQPITVYSPDDHTVTLVTGAHRVAAAKKLGWDMIDAFLVDGTEIDREMQEITENLHRSELTALERSEQIGRWAELLAAKAGQNVHPLGGHQPHDRGISKVAKDLGIERKDAERAVNVANISDEAKEAAREVGLDDNRSALLTVAREPTPEAQVAKVAAIAAAKAAVKSGPEPDGDPPPCKPADAAEANGFARAICTGLAGLDPIVDRIREIEPKEFWQLLGPSERAGLFIALDGLWRMPKVDDYKKLYRKGFFPGDDEAIDRTLDRGLP